MKKDIFYYPWYDTNRHWEEGIVLEPLLGKYSSKDVSIIQKHIDMLRMAKISTVIISWWGVNTFENSVIREVLIPQLESNKMSYYFLYERFIQNDLKQLKIDHEHFNKYYFSNKFYKKTNQKPDLFLYLTRTLNNEDLKEKLKLLNNDVYSIGDEIYWNLPTTKSLARLKLFDEISIYNPHISNTLILKSFWDKLIDLYIQWQEISKVNNILMTPTLIPGFDDREVRPQAKHPIIPRNPTAFINALKRIDGHNFDRVNICSFNEWHENTQIEPSTVDNFCKLLLTNYV